MLLLEGPKQKAAVTLTGKDFVYFELAEDIRFYLDRHGTELHASLHEMDKGLFECLESALFGADDYILECSDAAVAREITAGVKETLSGMRKIRISDQASIGFGKCAFNLVKKTQQRLERNIEPSFNLIAAWQLTPKTIVAPRDRIMSAKGKRGMPHPGSSRPFSPR